MDRLAIVRRLTAGHRLMTSPHFNDVTEIGLVWTQERYLR